MYNLKPVCRRSVEKQTSVSATNPQTLRREMALSADARRFILLWAHKAPEKSKHRADWQENTALTFLPLSPTPPASTPLLPHHPPDKE